MTAVSAWTAAWLLAVSGASDGRSGTNSLIRTGGPIWTRQRPRNTEMSK